MPKSRIPTGSRPLKNVISGDEVKRQLREEGFGSLLDKYANRRWWQKPLYWDKYDEPMYIGDVLFTVFVNIFPFLAAFVFATVVSGINFILTLEGAQITAIWGIILTLGWQYLLRRKQR